MLPLLRTACTVLACAVGMAGCADMARERPGAGPGHAMVNQAVISLASFAPEEFPALGPSLRDACAVMIFPRVISASFGLGASHGRGVLLVRGDTGGAWHGPAFVSVSEIDAGLQVAMGAREFVVVLHSCAPLASLYGHAASLHVGALLADQAGERGSVREAVKGVQVYARLRGVDVGAALNGTMLTVDDRLAEDFYGTPMSVAQIMAADSEADPIAIEMRRAVAYAAR